MKTKKCELPGCNNDARIRFCCNKHKDRYHNTHNPRGIYAHLADRRVDVDTDNFEYEHPLGGDGIGQDN